jgi:hypothetical protein
MIEYFITACNIAGTTTSPTGVSTSSPYGSFYEYTINCTPPSSGTQTIAFQGFEFAGSSGYTFSVDNTNTAPTDALNQNYPAHPSAIEWNYYNKGANGSLSAVNRNSCACMNSTYSGLPATCPDAGNPVYTAGGNAGVCRTYNGNSRGVYINTPASTESPTNSRSRNGSYSYIQQSRSEAPKSYIYFDDVQIPDAANATNIKVIAYVSSISTGSYSNGADGTDNVSLSVKYNSSNTANIMASDPTCGSDLYFFSSNTSTSVTGGTNSKWDFSGNTWSATPDISGTTTKHKLVISVPNGTTNVRAMITMTNNDAGNSELWAIDDVQIIADYPTVTPTTGRYYRSRQNGKWNAVSTWEVSTDAAFSSPQPACEYPTYSNSDSIIIMPTDTVRITADHTADQLRVAAGAKLILENNNFTIYNATGTDFVVNGTFEDNSVGKELIFMSGATWKYTSGATIIKTSSSAVGKYRTNYEGGISSIPSDADWYYRYKGVGVTNTIAVDMYYPNLYFDNIANSNTYAFNTSASALTGTTGGYCTVKGNLNIGTTGTGTVAVYNNNTNIQPMLILGNMTIGTGSTLITASYDGGFSTSYGNGTGFEVKGNVTVNGTLDANTASTGILKFSGTGTQVVSGSGTFDLWNVELSKPVQTLVDQQVNLTANNNLNFVGGILKTNTNVFTVANADITNAVTGHEVPFTSVAGAPSYANDRYVWGKLERNVNSNGLYVYPVGDAVAGEGYNPLRFDRKTGSGYATAEFIPGDPGACLIGPIYFTCNGENKFFQYSDMTGQGKWRMISSTATTFSYDIYLHPNQANINTYPNEDAVQGQLFYKNNYRALKAPNGTTDWSAYAGDPTICPTACGNICEVGSYYNIPGIGYSGFSDFAPAGGSGFTTALPVELTSFTASCKDDNVVEVLWTTATEFNSNYFILERSLDAARFETVAYVPAAVNSSTVRNYSVLDTGTVSNSNYYRLTEVDQSGKRTIYSLVYVRCREVNGWNAYHTPDGIVVEATTNSTKDIQIRLYEVSGKLLMQEKQVAQRGYNRYNMQMPALAKGVYIIQLLSGDDMESVKVWVP